MSPAGGVIYRYGNDEKRPLSVFCRKRPRKKKIAVLEAVSKKIIVAKSDKPPAWRSPEMSRPTSHSVLQYSKIT